LNHVLIRGNQSFSNADALQLRRAISIQAEGKSFLRSMLSRRQLQALIAGAFHL
jgi:hypothetical protein